MISTMEIQRICVYTNTRILTYYLTYQQIYISKLYEINCRTESDVLNPKWVNRFQAMGPLIFGSCSVSAPEHKRRVED
jgi:hypothetical protein